MNSNTQIWQQNLMAVEASTLCLKKVPTFKLSVTLSNLNHFQNFSTAGKRIKFATKKYDNTHYPSHLRHVAKIPWEIKKSTFCTYSADMEKMQSKCILSAPILIPLRM